MRFAMADNRRVEALPGQTGHCPSCGKLMIAKCGTKVIWHWAHKGVRCDGWWEPETPWHRTWKGKFPTEWQEVVNVAEDGERHIADIHTPHGLVIEFQHSRLKPQERPAREAYYENLVWVVDGTRLANEVDRFMQFKEYFHPHPSGWHGHEQFSALLSRWLVGVAGISGV
jgi:competence protein CoiA